MDNGPKKSKLRQMAEGYKEFRDSPTELTPFGWKQKESEQKQIEPDTPEEAQAAQQRFKKAINMIQSPPQPSRMEKFDAMEQEANDLDAMQQLETDPIKKEQILNQYKRIKKMIQGQ